MTPGYFLALALYGSLFASLPTDATQATYELRGYDYATYTLLTTAIHEAIDIARGLRSLTSTVYRVSLR